MRENGNGYAPARMMPNAVGTVEVCCVSIAHYLLLLGKFVVVGVRRGKSQTTQRTSRRFDKDIELCNRGLVGTDGSTGGRRPRWTGPWRNIATGHPEVFTMAERSGYLHLFLV